jgi:predicted DNA-binding transcriptional regulator AlpA
MKKKKDAVQQDASASADLMHSLLLAAYLGVSPRTPALWRSRKTGPPYFKVGSCVRYRKSDVDKWLLEHMHIASADMHVVSLEKARIPARRGTRLPAGKRVRA